VPLDNLEDDEGVILFKSMLVTIIVEKVFIKGGSIDVAIIKEVDFSKPPLQVNLRKNCYQFFF
jgi:hypothetical protein